MRPRRLDRNDFDRDFDRMGTWFWRFFTAIAVLIGACLVATVVGLVIVGPVVLQVLRRLAGGD